MWKRREGCREGHLSGERGRAADGGAGAGARGLRLSRPHQTQCGGPCAPSLASPNPSYRLASTHCDYKEAGRASMSDEHPPRYYQPPPSCTHPSAFSGSPWFSYPPGTPRLWRRLSSSASPGQYPAPASAHPFALRPPTDPYPVSRIQLCHSGHVQCSLQPRSWRSQRCRALGHRQRCPLRLLRRHRSRQRWYQQPCVPLSALSPRSPVLTVA